jgi:hypothetical protein
MLGTLSSEMVVRLDGFERVRYETLVEAEEQAA